MNDWQSIELYRYAFPVMPDRTTPESSATAAIATTASAGHLARPLVSVLLITYCQEHIVADAVRGALAQTWSPLEILISDDCSTDRTFEVIQHTVRDYTGPHRIVLNRNVQNLGISAHLSALAQMSHGELLVVMAGDDVSVPQRCARMAQTWLAHECRPDLIASDLVELASAQGASAVPALIKPTDLNAYHGLDDWLAHCPWLVGAAHAWSRRLFERFGDMQPGSAAEDQIMVFRAIMSGGAISLHEPLVQYRRGGLSGRKRWATVSSYVLHQRRSNCYVLAELAQLQRDACVAHVGEQVRAALAPRLARETYTRDIFAANGLMMRLRLLFGRHAVKAGFRIRMFLYAAMPFVYAPVFALKHWISRLHAK
jgi:glycosyltransferase involved in cell wall biosynthesis